MLCCASVCAKHCSLWNANSAVLSPASACGKRAGGSGSASGCFELFVKVDTGVGEARVLLCV